MPILKDITIEGGISVFKPASLSEPFMAVGCNSSSALTSTDGITWTQRVSGGSGSINYRGLC